MEHIGGESLQERITFPTDDSALDSPNNQAEDHQGDVEGDDDNLPYRGNAFMKCVCFPVIKTLKL